MVLMVSAQNFTVLLGILGVGDLKLLASVGQCNNSDSIVHYHHL